MPGDSLFSGPYRQGQVRLADRMPPSDSNALAIAPQMICSVLSSLTALLVPQFRQGMAGISMSILNGGVFL